MLVAPIPRDLAAAIVIDRHYLHRRPPMSWAYGLLAQDVALLGPGDVLGVVTFGTPPSRHLQMSACPEAPGLVMELNRLWVDDSQPRNTESAFVAAVLKLLPPRIVVSYADPVHGHLGYVYRALNFRYAGWTDMERKTPRLDYLPADPATHTRDAMRNGWVATRRRDPKVKYWTVTGNRTQRAELTRACGWPALSWRDLPPPVRHPGAA